MRRGKETKEEERKEEGERRRRRGRGEGVRTIERQEDRERWLKLNHYTAFPLGSSILSPL